MICPARKLRGVHHSCMTTTFHRCLVSALIGTLLVTAVGTAPSAAGTTRMNNAEQQRINGLIENFAVGEISGQRQFVVTLGTLVPLGEYLIDRQGRFPYFVDEIVVGRIRGGACKDTFRSGQGTWRAEGSRSAITVKLNMNVKVDGKRYWNVGSQPCVRRVVTWELPEELQYSSPLDDIFDQSPVDSTSAVSDFRLTPNTIPRESLTAAPALTGFVDVQLVTPPPLNVEPVLEDFDPSLLDGQEIVLPDFTADDGDADSDNATIDANSVRVAAVDLDTQFQDLARLFGVDTTNNQDQGAGNSPSRDALIAASRNPQIIASAIARARSALNVIQVATDASTSPAASQLSEQLTAYNQQLEAYAKTAPVTVSGGVVPADKVGSALGFNATQSPVAGLNGNGAFPGLSMKVTGPKTVKRGGKAKVRVTISPVNSKGVVRLAVLRTKGNKLQIVGAKQVQLKNGRASATVNISKKATSGGYTLSASLVPNTRMGSGITVQRPIRVN